VGRIRLLLMAVLGAVSLVAIGGSTAAADESHFLIKFDSMTPVTGAAVGNPNDRGIVGGGKPWAITFGKGELSADGRLHVRVKGLVIPVAPFNGSNPLTQFGVTVSCLTPGIVNVSSSSLFNTGPSGDATINTTLALPGNCMDPIVFVTSPGGAWFAMSNAEDDE